jgi:two-component system response regulator NreC
MLENPARRDELRNMTAGLRILIVDDEKAVRTALGRLLSTRGEWKVVGEAADGAEAIGKARELRPDVVIMDLTLPEMNGLVATPEIKKAIPSAEVLIFTQHESRQMIREAQKAGASGYLLKSQANWLVTAVEAIGQHKPFFDGKNLSKAQ